MNRLKEQSKTIASLTADLSQRRTDALQAQTKHTNWQQQLRERVAALREEKKEWQTDTARIRGELTEAQATIQRQQDELAIVKNEFVLTFALVELTKTIPGVSSCRIKSLKCIPRSVISRTMKLG